MARWQKRLYLLATGAVTFGWLQAFQGLNFNGLFAGFLTTIFSALVAALVQIGLVQAS